jgi:tRNA(Met) C34 N-acetyltransferase TmcA
MFAATLQHIERYAAAHLDARPHARECAVAIARHVLAPALETPLRFELEMPRRRGKSLGLAIAVAAIARAAHDMQRVYNMRMLALSRVQSENAFRLVLRTLEDMGAPVADSCTTLITLSSGCTIAFSPFLEEPMPSANDGQREEIVFVDESAFVDADALFRVLCARVHVACVTTPTRESKERNDAVFFCENGFYNELACL